MNFNEALANFSLGNIGAYQLPEIGIIALKEGLDSESLTILAGLSDKDSSYERMHYFEQALKELEIELPDTNVAIQFLLNFYADEIIGGKVDPIQGMIKIYSQVLLQTNLFEESKSYAYDSIGFHFVYGLYVSYQDLEESEIPGKNTEENKKVKQEIKSDIIDELKIWKTKYAEL